MSWHTLPDCTPGEPTMGGRCYNCGAREPEPVEDFDNGYCTELSGWGHTEYSLDWRDRANVTVLSFRRLMQMRYARESRFERLMLKESPMMRAIRQEASHAG